MQFTLADPTNPTSTDVVQRLNAMARITIDGEGDEDDELSKLSSNELEDEDDEDDDADLDLETSDETTDDPAKPGKEAKKKRKLRLAKLKKKTKARAYEFTGESDVVGMIFLEISKITDLPPERNSTSGYYPTSSICLISFSDTNIIRHGSLRCDFSGPKDVQNSGCSAQPKSYLR